MNKVYIEQFFDTGKLMLSSFQKFSAHADAMKNDDNEGETSLVSVARTGVS
jgi:hypothetical protein